MRCDAMLNLTLPLSRSSTWLPLPLSLSLSHLDNTPIAKPTSTDYQPRVHMYVLSMSISMSISSTRKLGSDSNSRRPSVFHCRRGKNRGLTPELILLLLLPATRPSSESVLLQNLVLLMITGCFQPPYFI
jgi:hypothetical protein